MDSPYAKGFFLQWINGKLSLGFQISEYFPVGYIFDVLPDTQDTLMSMSNYSFKELVPFVELAALAGPDFEVAYGLDKRCIQLDNFRKLPQIDPDKWTHLTIQGGQLLVLDINSISQGRCINIWTFQMP